MTKRQINLRIDENLLTRLEKACDSKRDPYAPSKTAVMERGLELALRELERRK